MDNTKESPVILSLCTGIRGLERGIERAMGSSLTVAAYVEIEAFIVENLLAGMEAGILDAAPIWTDLKTFPWQQFHGKVHGIIGGYPCQPFSHVGRQGGANDPRHLWPFIAEGIKTVRPVWCFFENVSNHINLGYEQVRSKLFELGYSVEEGLFSAEEVEAPHIRKRLFILAVDNTLCGRYGRSKEQICTRRQPSFLSSQIVDHSIHQGLQGYPGDEDRKGGWSKSIGSITPASFPMGQGYEQYGWEAPRTKSRMGCTVNGYNFREDLLRALGNGVVEQTAELAWKILWQKTLK